MKTGVALLATLTIAACSSPATPAAHSSTITAATHSTTDVAYLTRIRPTIPGGTDADLINAAHQACTLLDGTTYLEAADGLNKAGFDTDAAATIVVSAAATYCPQFKE